MKQFASILCVVLWGLISHTALAHDTTTMHERPKVGLVLSGGGAKGAAHIGVLKYIEEVGHSALKTQHSKTQNSLRLCASAF